MTFAPFVMHWSACDRCVVAEPRAFRMLFEIPSLLNAAPSSGRSKSSYRTDDVLSGSRTHACAVADDFWLLADAEAATTASTIPSATSGIKMRFICDPPGVSSGGNPGLVAGLDPHGILLSLLSMMCRAIHGSPFPNEAPRAKPL